MSKLKSDKVYYDFLFKGSDLSSSNLKKYCNELKETKSRFDDRFDEEDIELIIANTTVKESETKLIGLIVAMLSFTLGLIFYVWKYSNDYSSSTSVIFLAVSLSILGYVLRKFSKEINNSNLVKELAILRLKELKEKKKNSNKEIE